MVARAVDGSVKGFEGHPPTELPGPPFPLFLIQIPPLAHKPARKPSPFGGALGPYSGFRMTIQLLRELGAAVAKRLSYPVFMRHCLA